MGAEPSARVARPLRAAIGATALGNAAYAGSQFLTLVLLARLTTTSAVGEYSLALAIAAPIYLFLDLKLRIVEATDANGLDSDATYSLLRLVTTCLAALITCAVGLAVSLDGHAFLTLVAVAGFKAAESMNDIFYGALQRRQLMTVIAKAQAVRAGLTLVVMAVSLLLWRRVELSVGLAAVLLAGLAVRTAWAAARRGIDTRPRHGDWRRIAALALTALPVGLSVSLGSVYVNVPRYFINESLGAAALGVFAVLSYAPIVLTIVVQAAVESTLPALAMLAVRREVAAFRALVARLIRFGALIGLLGVVAAIGFGRFGLSIVFGAEYGVQWRPLVLLMAAAGVQYTVLFLGVAINALRNYRAELPVTALGLVAVVVLCGVVVGRGLSAVAGAVLVAQLVTAAGTVVVYRRVLRDRLQILAD